MIVQNNGSYGVYEHLHSISHSRSSLCSMSGVTKAVVYALLSVGW